MKSFYSFLKEAQSVVGVKSGHMSHAEDLVFDLGVEGTRKAIFFLRDVRDMLSQSTGTKKAVATVKWDGCLHPDTVLWTNFGEMTIKQLIENPDIWEETYVMGKDLESDIQIVKLTKLLSGSLSKSDKKWVEVQFENNQTLKLTEDHEIHTKNRGWVKAKDLIPDDDVTEM
jgi:hypothetical protein